MMAWRRSRRRAVAWPSAYLMTIGSLWMNFSEIKIKQLPLAAFKLGPIALTWGGNGMCALVNRNGFTLGYWFVLEWLKPKEIPICICMCVCVCVYMYMYVFPLKMIHYNANSAYPYLAQVYSFCSFVSSEDPVVNVIRLRIIYFAVVDGVFYWYPT